MKTRRTDLAMEAASLLSLGEKDGIFSKKQVMEGVNVEEVEVRTREASEKLGKPRGRYITVELDNALGYESGGFQRCVRVVAHELKRLVPREGTVLVAGLGNRRVTPDALGPLVGERLLITRHLVRTLPEMFGDFRGVCGVETGVLAGTGVESGELVRAVVEKVKPVCVIAVDALAARDLSRLCRTLQLCDTGISPGSGVGNRRWALTEENLGVKVVGVGVPTVVDAATLTADILEEAGKGEMDPASLRGAGESLFVTPRDIDEKVALCGKILGYAINLALQEGLTMEEMERLVE